MDYQDFDKMRNRMINAQLIARGISDEKVLNAFKKIPRHEFVPEENKPDAYEDCPLPIGKGQTISQPYMAALMTELLKLKDDSRVLEIGTGSGYQTAILCDIAAEVYSIERIPYLAERAGKILNGLGYKNFKINTGDGSTGWAEHSPYDGILVTAGAPKIPESLVAQLKESGRLVVPVGNSFSQVLTLVEKKGRSFNTEQVCGCVFVPLIGKDGWRDQEEDVKDE